MSKKGLDVMSILQTINLKKYYGKEPNITRALDGVDFSVSEGEFVAVVGTSGSGKSTLLNKLFPQLQLETGRISKKLGRGKHTTRQVEIFQMEDCMVADTPGFSSVELDYDNFISKNVFSTFPT